MTTTQFNCEQYLALNVLAPHRLGPKDPHTQRILRHSAELLRLHTDAPAKQTYMDSLTLVDLIICTSVTLRCLGLHLSREESIDFLTTFADNLELEARERECIKIGGTI